MAIFEKLTIEARSMMPDGVASCGDCDNEIGLNEQYRRVDGKTIRLIESILCTGCFVTHVENEVMRLKRLVRQKDEYLKSVIAEVVR